MALAGIIVGWVSLALVALSLLVVAAYFVFVGLFLAGGNTNF